MPNDGRERQRKKLIALGSERLADALLDLADRDSAAGDTIRRMTSGASESIKRYKAKLSALGKSNRFYSWKEDSEYTRELYGILDDLQAGVDDPCMGVELVADFFRCDSMIFEHGDDSSGNIGAVFTSKAQDLFARYASACTDKAQVMDLVETLYTEDEYGVRYALVDAACESLPNACLSELADRFWKRAEAKGNSAYTASHWRCAVKSFARQLKDPHLFEKASLAATPRRSGETYLEIAEVWLDAGDAQTALSWTKRIPKDEAQHLYDLDSLLLTIYKKLGNKQKLSETAWQMFREERSMDNLSTLLSVVGKENRERIIDEEAESILGSATFSESDAEFLMLTGRTDEAESYILKHADKLKGDYYTSLLPLAEGMVKDKRWLAASVIYRALLDSILGRAVSKYYHHGVRYLKDLDLLAQGITDWQGFQSHAEYAAAIRKAHSRKSSFWSQYGG